MTPTHRAALALSLAAGLVAVAGAAVAAPRAPFPLKATPGVRPYRYQVEEAINGPVQKGYRMDFDLRTQTDGSIDAIVRSGEEFDGKTWKPVGVPAACRAKMHAPRGALARVRLWPLSGGVAAGLGSGFLDTCAPGGVFFPLTDILNVAIIPGAGTFHAEALHKAGDSARYDGFTAAFDRAGERLKETTPGGEVRLSALDARRATVDWVPDKAELDLVEHGPQGQPLTLNGTEHWAFRLEIDTRTGALLRAATIYDDLDLTLHMAGVPPDKAPALKITRRVTIEPRKTTS